ncbi:MAG: hypothetical protein R3C46_01225 [Hyphomonadaceae bacterium]
MTEREKIDATLRSMSWGYMTAQNSEGVTKVEAVRALLPASSPPEDWGRFVSTILSTFFDAGWQDVDLRKLLCAAQLNQMCIDMDGNPSRLPEDVRAVYEQHNGRYRPQSGSIGGRKMMGAAFAMARGHHRGPSIHAAAEWIAGSSKCDGVLTIGERAGFKFPGLGRG